MHSCLDHARRRRRRAVEVELDPIDRPAGSDLAGDVADRDLVDRALRGLKPGHRAVVLVHYYLGMPRSDVAAAIGIPLGTAQSRLHYALATMRVTFGGEPARASASLAGGPTR